MKAASAIRESSDRGNLSRTKLAAIAIPEDQDQATQQLIRRAIDESFVSGFRCVMAIGAALAVASAATALFWIEATPPVHAEL